MSDPFAVTGVYFVGPVYSRMKKADTAKGYIALFTCTSTRSTPEAVVEPLSSAEFQRALKEFIARWGCPQILVRDNGKTFVATGKWLSTLKKDHNLASYVGALNITGKFNLARAPWWEGFFECLIGIVKRRSAEAFWPIESWKISWLTKRAVWTIDHFVIREMSLSNRCLPQITY